MNRLQIALLIASISVGFQGFSQEPVEIVDPNLTFTYLMPDDWTNSDDPYYHYITPPCASKGLELTYYDGRCKVIEDCFEAETKGAFPKKYKNYETTDTGKLLVGNTEAPWLTFTFSDEDGIKTGFYSTFIKLNQQFTFLFIAEKKCFESSRDKIISLIEDFRVQPN